MEWIDSEDKSGGKVHPYCQWINAQRWSEQNIDGFDLDFVWSTLSISQAIFDHILVFDFQSAGTWRMASNSRPFALVIKTMQITWLEEVTRLHSFLIGWTYIQTDIEIGSNKKHRIGYKIEQIVVCCNIGQNSWDEDKYFEGVGSDKDNSKWA